MLSYLRQVLILSLLSLKLMSSHGLANDQQSELKCGVHETCSSCIETPECLWCTNPKMINSISHCLLVSNTSLCPKHHQVNPQNMAKLVDIPDTLKERIQLSPQKYHLKLRKGISETIKVTYKQTADFPLDLYYLMDMSDSMKDDVAILASLGNKMANHLKKLTSQVRMGFGTFVDKPMLPFVNLHPVETAKPCDGKIAPYAFKNHLSLNNDTDKFVEEVNSTMTSCNLDNIECGLEALIQVMVCEDQIGWRKDSKVRRIIILSTDSKYHYAGDGRFAGIVTPHDLECHLDDNGVYTHYDKLDYPSIGQVNITAQKHKFNIIFAVSGQENTYSKLSKEIKGSTSAQLDKDSSNIIELVAKQYKQISEKLILDDDSTSLLSIQYFTKCKDKNGIIRMENTCDGIQKDDEVEFLLKLTLERCPSNPRDHSFTVKVNAGLETLVLNVEALCQCDCEQVYNKSDNEVSEVCNRAGTLKCGKCDCNEGYKGDWCQCNPSISHLMEHDKDTRFCRRHQDDALCSDRGICDCGKCNCHQTNYYGRYCECDLNRCRFKQDLNDDDDDLTTECSGHGDCDCNTCSCHEGYEGVFCECAKEHACRQTNTSSTCSGHGSCECGNCKCDRTEDFIYTGQYCEECPTCDTNRCLQLKDCVQCKVHLSGEEKEENGDCNDKCDQLYITYTDSVEGNQSKGVYPCTALDHSTGCEFEFTYQYKEEVQDRESSSILNMYTITAENEQRCTEVQILGIVSGVAGAIVAIGVLTLIIWKIITSLNDQKEYQAFIQASEMASKTKENRYYVAPETTVENPAYGKRKTGSFSLQQR